MTEELQGALTEILKGVLSAKDFMLAELPEVIQQLLLWKATLSIIWFIAAVAVLICLISQVKKFWAVLLKEGCGAEVFIIFYLMLPVGAFFIAIANLTWLQIWIAPKVYLIEYAASLAK